MKYQIFFAPILVHGEQWSIRHGVSIFQNASSYAPHNLSNISFFQIIIVVLPHLGCFHAFGSSNLSSCSSFETWDKTLIQLYLSESAVFFKIIDLFKPLLKWYVHLPTHVPFVSLHPRNEICYQICIFLFGKPPDVSSIRNHVSFPAQLVFNGKTLHPIGLTDSKNIFDCTIFPEASIPCRPQQWMRSRWIQQIL